ncbi:MAG: hypothetical protein UE068_01935 [Paludibacteraceae bacterium]|nr:hypothetical protein [Paludibacteraceae bacterium]
MEIGEREKKMCVRNGLDLNTPIYKYIPLKYVITMLSNKKLYVGKVKEWDDPYENFFLKQTFLYGSEHIIATDDIIKVIYGQSWTTEPESDAMWRIYSNKKNLNDIAIKIKTTAQKLFEAVYISEDCSATTSIGSVEYKKIEDITKWMETLNISTVDDIGKNIVPSLYMKRIPFSHEKEVRIIINKVEDLGDYIEYDINPESMFDEFVIDPRVDNNNFNKIINRLTPYIMPCKISRSSLYGFTPSEIQI